MTWNFVKYHGTGNDFIIIDDRGNKFPDTNQSLIADWCTRRFGIGADGLMLLRYMAGVDFKMVYFNSDGRESSMCGNGGRCIVHYAQSMGLVADNARFMAIDGLHEAFIRDGLIHLKMMDVEGIEQVGSDCVLDTGSPHYVQLQAFPEQMDLLSIAHDIRYSARYRAEGINVNLVAFTNNGHIQMRTYERGVEAETYSCGTGAVAAALSVAYLEDMNGTNRYQIDTLGGPLMVECTRTGKDSFNNIWLIGPATPVYEGTINM